MWQMTSYWCKEKATTLLVQVGIRDALVSVMDVRGRVAESGMPERSWK